MKKQAFTMIELIFVIVILGILVAIALPKFSGIKEEADISKAKADLATIRSILINDRQKNILIGTSTWMSKTDFDAIMSDYSDWKKDASAKYSVAGCTFLYDDSSGKFATNDESKLKDVCNKIEF